jgi:hypothetical protein
MKNIQGSGNFTQGNRYKGNTLYGQTLYAPPHLFHVTYSKYNELWYVKEIEGNTYSAHRSQEEALQEARELARDDDNGQVILHHPNGLLEIVDKYTRH